MQFTHLIKSEAKEINENIISSRAMMKDIYNETKGNFMVLKEGIVENNKRSAEILLELSGCGESIGQVKEGVKVVIDITEEIRNES
jgi:hypothetical protein